MTAIKSITVSKILWFKDRERLIPLLLLLLWDSQTRMTGIFSWILGFLGKDLPQPLQRIQENSVEPWLLKVSRIKTIENQVYYHWSCARNQPQLFWQLLPISNFPLFSLPSPPLFPLPSPLPPTILFIDSIGWSKLIKLWLIAVISAGEPRPAGCGWTATRCRSTRPARHLHWLISNSGSPRNGAEHRRASTGESVPRLLRIPTNEGPVAGGRRRRGGDRGGSRGGRKINCVCKQRAAWHNLAKSLVSIPAPRPPSQWRENVRKRESAEVVKRPTTTTTPQSNRISRRRFPDIRHLIEWTGTSAALHSSHRTLNNSHHHFHQ